MTQEEVDEMYRLIEKMEAGIDITADDFMIDDL